METVEANSIEEAIELTYELGWTDGLPVVPPTTKLIQTALDYLKRCLVLNNSSRIDSSMRLKRAEIIRSFSRNRLILSRSSAAISNSRFLAAATICFSRWAMS